MTRLPLRPVAALAVLALAAGCGRGGTDAAADSSAAGTVRVTLTDAGCTPQPASVPAGPVTFAVRNDGAAGATEVELVSGSRILGEKENLAPVFTGSFSLRLQPGSYHIYCPGTKAERTPFTVTAGSGATAGGRDAALAQATAGYAAYVRGEAAALTAATKRLAAALDAGDLRAAKQRYAAARVHFERIEPVAESFGALDPAIDARANDVPNRAQWTGFHRIEQALWQRGTTAGTKPVGARLVADVTRLQRLVDRASYQPAQLANGAAGLLDEVARSKVTGEEERYSHLDLLDMAANLDGARKAVDLLAPALQRKHADLLRTIRARFAAVDATLAAHRHGGSYDDYRSLTPAQVRALAGQVDALAEPLSQVAGAVVSP